MTTTVDMNAQLNAFRPLIARIIASLRASNQIQPHIEDDDAEQAGLIAAWKAIGTYVPAWGTLTGHVGYRVRCAILDYQRQQARVNGYGRRGRVATITSLDTPVITGPAIDGDEGQPTVGGTLRAPDDTAREAHARLHLAATMQAVATLNTRDQRVILSRAVGTRTSAVAALEGITPCGIYMSQRGIERRVTKAMERAEQGADS